MSDDGNKPQPTLNYASPPDDVPPSFLEVIVGMFAFALGMIPLFLAIVLIAIAIGAWMTGGGEVRDRLDTTLGLLLGVALLGFASSVMFSAALKAFARKPRGSTRPTHQIWE